MNRWLVFALAALLITLPVYGEQSVQERVSKWPMNQRMEATLRSGDKLAGHLGTVDAKGFELKADKQAGVPRQLAFGEVKSVKTKWTLRAKVLIVAAVWGGLALVGSRL